MALKDKWLLTKSILWKTFDLMTKLLSIYNVSIYKTEHLKDKIYFVATSTFTRMVKYKNFIILFIRIEIYEQLVKNGMVCLSNPINKCFLDYPK